MCFLMKYMGCIIFIFVTILFWTTCKGVTKLPENVIRPPGICAFGDSILDSGNNNVIETIFKSNFPPYGKDFPGGVPTGRFSNGKTPVDMIGEVLGIKEVIPAYLDPNLKDQDLPTGVSFASSGSGYDPLTSKLLSVISLSDQLELFKEYIAKLKEIIGEEETNKNVGNIFYVTSSGSNDLANTYFTFDIRRLQYNISSYADLIVGFASNFVQEMYKLGARKIAVFGIPPIGCLPAQRTLSGGINRSCVEKYNQATQLVNAKLSQELDSLKQRLPHSKAVYIDTYNPLLHLIQNPQNYGFEVIDKGCCGTGDLEASIFCNKYSETCANASKYIFWDSYHPTETAYRVLVDQILQKYIGSFT